MPLGASTDAEVGKGGVAFSFVSSSAMIDAAEMGRVQSMIAIIGRRWKRVK